MNSDIIGKRMRALRKKHGMTMAVLSKAVGLSQAQICKLELGRFGFRSSTLERIARALKVDTGYFLQDWTPDGVVKKLRLGGKLTQALRDPEFLLLVRKLADSHAGTKRLIHGCLAMTEVLSPE